MIIKFNKYERVAGLIVIMLVMSSLGVLISVAVQKGWFAQKVQFSTVFENADGIHSGTSVQISGLHAGSVEDVELLAENEIKVTFTILKKFASYIHQDSKAQLVRPFIIGDRVLKITVGKNETPLLAENSSLPSYETMDLMTILNDNKLGQNMETMAELIDNLKVLVNVFTDKSKAESFVRVFDKIEPLINNLNNMSVELAKLSKQATKNDNLATVLENANNLTKEINDVLPMVKENAPGLGRDMTLIVSNLAQFTEDFKALTPIIVEMAPTLPKTGRRTVEFIDEFVVLLKAMQKTIFLKGNAEEVREEEALSTKKVNENGVFSTKGRAKEE